MQTVDICHRCHAPASKLCGQCKFVKYCSRECQVADWKLHKSICSAERDSRIDEVRTCLSNKKFMEIVASTAGHWQATYGDPCHMICRVTRTEKIKQVIEDSEQIAHCDVEFASGTIPDAKSGCFGVEILYYANAKARADKDAYRVVAGYPNSYSGKYKFGKKFSINIFDDFCLVEENNELAVI